MLKEFTPKISYTLDRNPELLLPGPPYLDRRRGARHSRTTPRAFNAFRAKEIHDPGQLMDAEDKRIVDRSHPDLFMGEVPGADLVRPCASTPRSHRSTTRACAGRIHLAIDRQGVIDATRFGRAGLARWLPPATGQFATPENEVVKLPWVTASRRTRTWRRRGACSPRPAPNGFATELKATAARTSPPTPRSSSSSSGGNLNLDVKLVVLERAVTRRSSVGRNFRLSIEYALSAAGDPTRPWASRLHSGANYGQWKNARYDEL